MYILSAIEGLPIVREWSKQIKVVQFDSLVD